MAPRPSALLCSAFRGIDFRVTVELIVPKRVVVVAVVDLIKRGAERICYAAPAASAAFCKRRIFAARENVLLAKRRVVLNDAAERADSLFMFATTGKA